MVRIGGRAVLRALGRFSTSERGGIAVWAAFMVPAVSLLAIGATELAALHTDRAHLQDVADASALMGAGQLTVGSPETAAEQAKAHALAETAGLAERSTVTAEVSPTQDGAAIKVRLTSHRSSFFGNMLPPGGFLIAAQATAMKMTAPGSSICLMGLDAGTGAAISLRNNANVKAPACRVHSNSNIAVMNSSLIQAESTQAVGSAAGPISPAALTGAEAVADPFASKVIDVAPCDAASWTVPVYDNGVYELEQGVHCGDFVVSSDAVLKLLPGKHVFTGYPGLEGAGSGKLSVKNRARLVGDNVVLYFGKYSKFEVRDQADIDLVGAKTGEDAGMLMVAARDNNKTWMLSSKAIRRLEGVIYLPAAELDVRGGSSFSVAHESKWSIAIVRRLSLMDSLSFVLNSNYSASSVPLPGAAATRDGEVRLVN